MPAPTQPCTSCGEPVPPKRGPGRRPTRCEACRTAPRTCEECGRAYEYPGTAPRRFCSSSCASRHRHRLAGHRLATDGAPAEPDLRACFVCGETFTAGAKAQKFCSEACRIEFDKDALGLLQTLKAPRP